MEEEKDIKLWPWMIFGPSLVIVLWVFTPNLIFHFYPDNYGRFGDLFGSINALFSGLAFLGVIIAILLQRKELKDQRKELELTRKVHEETTKILDEQKRFHAARKPIQDELLQARFRRSAGV